MSCYSEKVRKGTKYFCKLHVLQPKFCNFYEYLTKTRLFRSLFIAKLVNIDISACFFGGIAEEAELGAHEEATPVETEAIVLGADAGPLLTVEAVVEVGAVGSAHKSALS